MIELKIYIDLLFILNLLFDFIVLGSVCVLLRRNISLNRLLLGSFIGASSVYLLFFNIEQIFLIKCLISIIMVLVTFKYKDIVYTLKNIVFLYMVSFVMGGVMYALNLQFSYNHSGLIFFFKEVSLSWWMALLLTPIIVYIFVKQNVSLRNYYSNYYMVDIYLKNGKIIKTSAFLDTGNQLYDPYYLRPIILVDKTLIKFDLNDRDVLLVPYEALNTKGLLKCIIPDKIHIIGVGIKKNVVVGLSNKKIKMDGVNTILHTALLEAK